MKIFKTSIFFLLMFAVFAPSVLAVISQDGTASGRVAREAVKQEKLMILEQKHIEIMNKVQEKKDETKAKVQAMKDLAKQRAVEKIQENLNRINDNRVEHFLNVLDRLTKIVEKIESRKEKLSEKGADIVLAETAITLSYTAITKAQTQVEAQGTNDYSIEVTGDTTARSEVQTLIKKYHNDLRVTRQAVFDARTAVHNAFKALRDVHRTWTQSQPQDNQSTSSAQGV